MDMIWNDPLTWIGLGFMVVIILVITLDIVVIPTMIATVVVMTGWFIYLIYTYNREPTIAFFLGAVFLILGGGYLFIAIKLKLWKWVVQENKVPEPPEDHLNEIHSLNQEEVTAHTDLRPVGKIRAGGKVLDGLSETGFIPRGARLIILSYVEGQYKVRIKKD